MSDPNLPNDEFLTVKQAAAFFKMSAAMIYRLCELKKLGHYRFGEGRGAIRISRGDVSDFLKKSRVEQDEPPRPVPAPPPLILKHLDLRPTHDCGATMANGEPCRKQTREERCGIHRERTPKNGRVRGASR